MNVREQLPLLITVLTAKISAADVAA